MASVFKGYNGVTRNRERFTWSKTDGWQSEVTYEGSRANILNIAGNVSLWADDLSIDADGPTASLIARVGRDVTGAADNAATDVTTSWNLQSNEVQRDLREATVIRELSETQIVAVERAATAAKVYTETAVASSFIPATGWNTAQKNLFWFYVRDQHNFLDHEFVLSKNELVTSYYTVGVSMAGVGKLWTASQITAAEGALPDAMAASVTSIASNTTPTNDGLAMPDGVNKWYYRWLKKAPNITQTSGGKFERSTEWWLGLWPTWLYPTQA